MMYANDLPYKKVGDAKNHVNIFPFTFLLAILNGQAVVEGDVT